MRTAVMPAFLMFRSVNATVWCLATRHVQRFLTLTLLSVATVASGIANAGGLQVSPVTLSLTQAERAGIFTISNNSERPMNAQARVFKWTQTAEDEYVLEPTNDLLVSPPIMQLSPGVPQELRVIRTQAAGNAEQQYRLIIDQLPTAAAASVAATELQKNSSAKRGVSILIRHNIPVFLNSTDRPVVQLQWRAEAAGKDKTRISMLNTSARRAQIARIWLEKGDKTTELSAGLTGYALPGSTLMRELNIPLAQIQATGAVLKARINDAETTIQLGN